MHDDAVPLASRTRCDVLAVRVENERARRRQDHHLAGFGLFRMCRLAVDQIVAGIDHADVHAGAGQAIGDVDLGTPERILQPGRVARVGDKRLTRRALFGIRAEGLISVVLSVSVEPGSKEVGAGVGAEVGRRVLVANYLLHQHFA